MQVANKKRMEDKGLTKTNKLSSCKENNGCKPIVLWGASVKQENDKIFFFTDTGWKKIMGCKLIAMFVIHLKRCSGTCEMSSNVWHKKLEQKLIISRY